MIDEKDIDRLKEIFVTRRECQDITEDLAGKLGREDTRLAVIEMNLKQIKWLLGGVLLAALTSFINTFFGLIGG